MRIPKIDGHNITDAPKNYLLELFLNSDASDEEKSLVNLLSYAAPTQQKAIEILNECLLDGKELVAYYPKSDRKEPKGELIGDILDGSLWLVNHAGK